MTTPRWEASAEDSSVRTSLELVRQRATTTPRREASARDSSVRTSSKLVRQPFGYKNTTSVYSEAVKRVMTTPRWEASTRDSSARTNSKLARQSFGNTTTAVCTTTTSLADAQEGLVLSHTPVRPIVHWPETDISAVLPKPCKSRMISVLEESSQLPFQHGRELTPIPEDTPTEVIDNDSSGSNNPERQVFVGAIVPAISDDKPSVNGESATTRAARLAGSIFSSPLRM